MAHYLGAHIYNGQVQSMASLLSNHNPIGDKGVMIRSLVLSWTAALVCILILSVLLQFSALATAHAADINNNPMTHTL
jgi:hypothetical protein